MRSRSRTMRTTWREMPRGRGTTCSSPHSSSGVDHGSVTIAGSGRLATIRSAMRLRLVRGVGETGLEQNRPGALGGHLVVGVGQPARLEAQAPAADAAVQPVPQQLDPADLLVEPGPPGVAEAVPVGLGRRTPIGKGRERRPDLVEAEADPLRGADERDPAQGRLWVPALVA